MRDSKYIKARDILSPLAQDKEGLSKIDNPKLKAEFYFTFAEALKYGSLDDAKLMQQVLESALEANPNHDKARKALDGVLLSQIPAPPSKLN